MKPAHFFLASAALAVAVAAPAGAQTVGKVSAVNQNAKGAKPGAAARALGLGADVSQNERIETDAQGSAQLGFNDRSTMNIGRNSSVVIDKFVYNGAAGSGEMAVGLARGAMRFVGGQVSHTTGATIRTNAATIGVRGGVASIVQGGPGGLHVILHYGTVTVQNAAGRQVWSRPGFEVVVAGPNSPPGAPQRVNQGFLQQINARLTSQGAQHGGAANLPTDIGSARFGIGSPRPETNTPIFDLPATLDDAARGGSGNANTPRPQPPVDQGRG